MRYSSLSRFAAILTLLPAPAAPALALDPPIELLADDTSSGDLFGYPVVIDGDTLVVGATLKNDSAMGAGVFYVFVRAGAGWVQQARLTADDPDSLDFMEAGMALQGDTLILGAPRDDDAGIDAGAVYVFERQGEAWSRTAKLYPADGAPAQLGRSVALDGDTLLAGAPYDDDLGDRTGAVYVFVRGAGGWSLQSKIALGPFRSFFGDSVSLDGETALIGAPLEDTLHGRAAGTASIFTRSGNTWTRVAKLRVEREGQDVAFGSAVLLMGDTAVIGAPFDDLLGRTSGSVFVFEKIGGAWIVRQNLFAHDRSSLQLFGSAISVSGDRMVIGAPQRDGSGSAYIFTLGDAGWVETEKILNPHPDSRDAFGVSVFVHRRTIAVGAAQDDAAGLDSGILYVYDGERHLDLLEDLILDVLSMSIDPEGLRNSLATLLENALRPHDEQRLNADRLTRRLLDAFIRIVEAHRGEAIAEEDAEDLVVRAMEILDLLNERPEPAAGRFLRLNARHLPGFAPPESGRDDLPVRPPDGPPTDPLDEAPDPVREQ